jgi:poly-beta-1,6-N-acetyl-D-glucosamine N-deacetylase
MPIFRQVKSSTRGGGMILCYHKIQDVANFDLQIRYLNMHYSIVGVDDYLKNVSKKDIYDSRQVLLTFDDGDISLKDNVMPVLKSYNLNAIAFVVTGLIDSEIPFWWDEVLYNGNDQLQLRKLKSVSDEERLAYLKTMRDDPSYRPLTYRQLTRSDLQELESSGISIASHSHTHPCLDKCDSKKKIDELSLSSIKLKEWGHRHYNLIAYPNGNYDKEVVSIALGAGYLAGFAFDHRKCFPGQDTMALSRLMVSDTTPIWKLKLILANIHPHWVKFRKWAGL